MSDKSPFSGDGFSRDPIEGEEAAKHREAVHELSDMHPSLSGLHDLLKGGKRLGGLVVVLGAVGGGVAYLVRQGFFG